jgi:hypothetical protein
MTDKSTTHIDCHFELKISYVHFPEASVPLTDFEYPI